MSNATSENSVRMAPGSISTTRIPNGRSSRRNASLMASTAYFVAWYAPPSGNVMRPPTELTLRIRPRPRFRICGRNARVTAISPNTLVSNCFRNSASVIKLEGAHLAEPGVVNQDVDPAPVRQGIHSALCICDALVRTNVEADDIDLPAAFFAKRGERAFAAPAGDDVVAALCEVKRCVAAKARGGAGDENRV